MRLAPQGSSPAVPPPIAPTPFGCCLLPLPGTIFLVSPGGPPPPPAMGLVSPMLPMVPLMLCSLLSEVVSMAELEGTLLRAGG